MSLVIIALVAVVAALVLIWAELRPNKAERSLRLFEGGRKILGLVFLIVFAFTALQSGRWYLVLAALVAIAVATLYVAVEKPHRRVA